MVMKKIISTLLAVLMLAGSFALLTAAEDATDTFEPEYYTSYTKPTISYMNARVDFKDTDSIVTSQEILTARDKLATMECRVEKDGYRLYVDEYSGEIGVECIETGEILLSNPYNWNDVGDVSAENKLKLMSQLVVSYKSKTDNLEQEFFSADWSVGKAYNNGDALDDKSIEPSQIRVKNIKNGLRVEYTIGREQSKMLVPRRIEKSAFETKIKEPLRIALAAAVVDWAAQYEAEGKSPERAMRDAEADADILWGKVLNYYKPLDPESPDFVEDYYTQYPITKKMAIYVLQENLPEKEMARIEQIIKTYVPDYTFEELDADHQKVEYVDTNKNPPLFKMALEYTLDEQGLSVRLPANGIRYTESLYELLSVQILPFMGAVPSSQAGYTFFPDGSGTLFDYEQIAAGGATYSVTSQVYGQDFAYHTIEGAHKEPVRYPVFGIVSEKNSFVAIVEEGDAMMKLTASFELDGTQHNTVKMTVEPRPRDKYNIADAISVGANKMQEVVSPRKYTGSYKIRYVMLGAKAGETSYEASYVGMAKAYRNYLEKQGVLQKLTEEDVRENIPLYIETFGAMKTTERFLSVPFEVMTPLTTFADINTMYSDLSAEGVDNVNFILTGYTKGGMTSPTVPYRLKWDKAVEEGGMNFEELTAAAKEKGFGIFPDFDFAFVKQDVLFDGLSLRKHAVKTCDDRYSSKREYSATKQTYISYFELALSPAYFSHFYTKLTKNFLKYDPIGISVSTLGSYLNSDFDEDEPYNREDAKAFTVEAFAHFRENYSKVMTSGGNAYSWKYVDYITDIALDSSRYSASSASVPFLGIVLHGYVEFAGTPINMEGNINYAILKALESGAGLQFVLSYRNTENLKEDEILSKYYSIRYNIWKDDLVSLYSEVNGLLKGVQTSAIVEHYFLKNGERVPDNDELEADAKALIESIVKKEQQEKLQAEKDRNFRILSARNLLKGTGEDYEILKNLLLDSSNDQAKLDFAAANTAKQNFNTAENKAEALSALYSAVDTAMKTVNNYMTTYLDAKEGYEILREKGDYATELDTMEANLALLEGAYNRMEDAKTSLEAMADEAYDAYRAEFPNDETVGEYVYSAEKDESTADATEEVSKYASDANKIVYVKYENGTAFILNFNNYDVVVEDRNTGIAYTVEAYGYVYLKSKTNA